MREANNCISNAIAKLSIFRHYVGDAIRSSSGGQKFETSIHTLNARHSPKYFGLKKGVVSYTLVANNVPIRESISNRGQGKAEALSSDRLARSWNTILSPSLLCPPLDSGDPTGALAALCLVATDSTLADLHVVLQIGFDWTTSISIVFASVRKTTPCHDSAGSACHDARKIRLADLHFRVNERFLYEYDFCDLWQHQVRSRNGWK